MVSVGSKSLPSRRHRIIEEDSLMGERGKFSNNHSSRKRGMGRKAQEGGRGFDGDSNKRNQSGGAANVKAAPKKQSEFEHQNQFVRKEIDPETSKYFSEIANLFDSNEVDIEERSVICGNALEETRGREYEIATDYIISHVLQTLLEGCELDQLCSFLRKSATVFPAIAMDRSGSHVAESALKSLATHLENPDAYSVIEEALNSICKVIVDNPLDMMCNCYGSHVLRRLLCLCKGVSIDSAELHGAKSSKALAKRLNLKMSQLDKNNLQFPPQGFPDVLKYLLSGLLNCSRGDMKYLQVDQYSSLVLQCGNIRAVISILPRAYNLSVHLSNSGISSAGLSSKLKRSTVLQWLSGMNKYEVVQDIEPDVHVKRAMNEINAGLEPLLGILRKLSLSPLRDSSFISLLICKSLSSLLEAKSMEAGAI